MRQWTRKKFISMIMKNGFQLNRHSGSHSIYTNDKGRHISIPKSINSCIALRLIKENNLKLD